MRRTDGEKREGEEGWQEAGGGKRSEREEEVMEVKERTSME